MLFLHTNIRHARPWAGHPRFEGRAPVEIVDGRAKPGHDGSETANRTFRFRGNDKGGRDAQATAAAPQEGNSWEGEAL